MQINRLADTQRDRQIVKQTGRWMDGWIDKRKSLCNSSRYVKITKCLWFPQNLGSRDGAVVRALASHQCGPGSIPGLGVICGLSLLLVLVPAPRVFLRVLRFSSLHKNQHFQIPIRPGNSGEKSHPVDSTEILIYFIYFLFILKSVY